jgi:asparagine synthetase B (glutamine-hydrolysing)
MDWKDKLEKIKVKISEKDNILVAFSGGVDSSLLAKISRDNFGRECTFHHLRLGDSAQEGAKVRRGIGKIFELELPGCEMLIAGR